MLKAKVLDFICQKVLEIKCHFLLESTCRLHMITIDLDGMKMGTVLTVKDIPELMGEKIELQVEKDEVVVRLSERKNYIETPVEE